jgi:hypothetical protein
VQAIPERVKEATRGSKPPGVPSTKQAPGGEGITRHTEQVGHEAGGHYGGLGNVSIHLRSAASSGIRSAPQWAILQLRFEQSFGEKLNILRHEPFPIEGGGCRQVPLDNVPAEKDMSIMESSVQA